MAILFGTQSNGETLPVLVDQYGNLLAKGINGPPGPAGPAGGTFALPPDPYEGALLGWLNDELAWIGTPPVPVPTDIFGPITAWDPAGLLTVEGEIPEAVAGGVYIYQINEDGSIYVDGWNQSAIWSDAIISGTTTVPGTSQPITLLKTFNGDLTDGDGLGGNDNNPPSIWTLPEPVNYTSKVELYIYANKNNTSYYANDRSFSAGDGFSGWATVLTGNGVLRNIGVSNSNGSGFSNRRIQINAVKVDGNLLVDGGEYPSAPNLNFRVESISGQSLVGTENRTNNFTIGKYLKVPEQNVARWLYDGNLNKVITSMGIDISRLSGN